jgi:hypothetical protein
MPISINGTGTISGISAGGLPSGIITGDTISNGSISTADIADGSITAPKLGYQNFNFRNRIINGDMRIDQRNEGASYAITSSLYGSCDRWGSLAGANGVWSQQRVTTGSTDFPFAMRVQRTAGSTSTAVAYVGQVIETSNCQDLAGQSATVSFYATAGANFSASGTVINCNVYGGTGEDQGWLTLNQGSWTGFASLMTLSQAITTTRTRYSVTATLPSGIKEIAIRFDVIGTGTAGANDWFQITGVQLEAGSTATEFERRPIGTELALCQRYYVQHGVASGGNTIPLVNGYMFTTLQWEGVYHYPVEMRTTPTLTSTAPSTFSLRITGTAATAINAYAQTPKSMIIYTANAAAGALGYSQALSVAANNTGYLMFSAEL